MTEWILALVPAAGLALLGVLSVYRWYLRRKLARLDAELAAWDAKEDDR